jgi:hypothetical protein
VPAPSFKRSDCRLAANFSHISNPTAAPLPAGGQDLSKGAGGRKMASVSYGLLVIRYLSLSIRSIFPTINKFPVEVDHRWPGEYFSLEFQ